MIQLIRTSENAAEAKDRLMSVFDLSDLQATYILDMALRRLTKYSRLELDKRRAELEETIAGLDAILGDDALLRKVVSDELNDVARTYGTPRRTVLLESAGQAVSATVALEVADDPCFVFLSSSGLLARTTGVDAPGDGEGRAKHDVIVSAVRTTARGQVGALTTAGRLVRLDVLDLPTLPGTANHPHLQGGAPVSEFLSLDSGERVLALVSLSDGASFGYALGTRDGVVKRVHPELLNRDSWEVVRLGDGDEVVGAVELGTGDEELVFVTSDAQLLHFPASGVRPQGRSGGGMAGVRLTPKQRVVFFGAFGPDDDAVVVTASGSSTALPGTEPGSVKVTPFSEYPPKGRGTGGVRCHRFLKGEDTLVFAYAGPGPVRAAAASGAAVDLPEPTGRRDGSGLPGTQPVVAASGPVRALVTG